MTYVKRHFNNLVLQLLAVVLLAIAADAQGSSLANDIPGLIPGAPQSIAFASTRDGNNEVYVMDGDGNNENRVTDNLLNTSNDRQPEISPDGSKIVFNSNRDGNFEIFVMDADGNNVTQLTATSAPIANIWPRWSPDGEWIAFQSGTSTNTQIFRIRPDGSDLTQLTQTADAALNLYPGWSPDGSRLVIRRGTELFLINSSDGLGAFQLTSTSSIPGAFNQMASFSPDGTRIAFLSNRAGYASVFIMNSDGSGEQVNFTPKPGGYAGTWASRAPAWSPNGEYLYFTAVRSITSGTAEQIFTKAVSSLENPETQLTLSGANFEATVRRVTAPVITSVTASPNVLWPADGKMVPVALTVDVTDNSDPSPVCGITEVVSNEPVGVEPDWEITGLLTLDLRALRLGTSRGRRYSVTVTCTNTSALSSTGSVIVTVPHDQRKGPSAAAAALDLGVSEDLR